MTEPGYHTKTEFIIYFLFGGVDGDISNLTKLLASESNVEE